MKKNMYCGLCAVLAVLLLAACGVMPAKPEGPLDGAGRSEDISSADRSSEDSSGSRSGEGAGSGSEETGAPPDASVPAADSQEDRITDATALWTEIQGIWGAADLTAGNMEFDVYEFDEDGRPVNYYVWGFEPSSASAATGMRKTEDGRYEVTLEGDGSPYNAIFDLSKLEEGELTVTGVNTGVVLHYIRWGSTFEEVYDKLHVYG